MAGLNVWEARKSEGHRSGCHHSQPESRKMEQLRNSLEIALYCMARDEARAGYSCRSDDFFDRDKVIFEAGYEDGKRRPLCAPLFPYVTAIAAEFS